MIIKFTTMKDFLDFFNNHTQNATVFIFDSATGLDGFLVCDARYTLTYQSANHKERNDIIDYFQITLHLNTNMVYGQSLPSHTFSI